MLAHPYRPWEPSINDVTALGERGYQRFCDDSTKALLLKSVTKGGGVNVSKNIKYCVTSFMDDPLPQLQRFQHLYYACNVPLSEQSLARSTFLRKKVVCAQFIIQFSATVIKKN